MNNDEIYPNNKVSMQVCTHSIYDQRTDHAATALVHFISVLIKNTVYILVCSIINKKNIFSYHRSYAEREE